MYEKVLVLQVFSKRRSNFVKKHWFIYAKWGDMYENIGFTSTQ